MHHLRGDLYIAIGSHMHTGKLSGSKVTKCEQQTMTTHEWPHIETNKKKEMKNERSEANTKCI